MFYVLGDVYAISSDGESFQVYEEFPVKMIDKFAEMTGCNHTRLIVNLMEYGKDFSSPGADVFRNGENGFTGPGHPGIGRVFYQPSLNKYHRHATFIIF